MFTLHRLPNGLRIILAPQHETAAVSLLVLVKVGSRFEKSAEGGISHFLEHLMFKGTRRRPSTLIISQELDAIGAEYNAYTAKDHTGYYIKATSGELPLVVDMLADMLADSLLAPEEVERERGTILEEINMYEDNPMAKVENLFEEDLFGRGTPLGHYIIGTPDRIRSLSRGQIAAYWRRHYQAANMVIALAGNFKPKKALALLREKFGHLPRGARNAVTVRARLPRQGKLVAHYKETNQGHLILGWPGLSYTHRDREALALLATILGGNMSSRLFIQVRERLGLCYFIRAGTDAYEETGTFTVQAGLDLRKIGQAFTAISAEIKNIKTAGVDRAELDKAKQYIKGKTELGLEESLDVASFYGKQALFQRQVRTPEQAIKKVLAVPLSDITRLARQILSRPRAQVALLSPFKSARQFAKHLDI